MKASEALHVEYGRASEVDSVRRVSSGSLHRDHVAEIVGLPALPYIVLPSGHREFRFQIVCDLCLPDYLVRIIQKPAAQDDALSGQVFALVSLSVERRDPDEERKVEARLKTWADSIASRVACGDWREGDFVSEVYHWCVARERPVRAWQTLLRQLDSLNVLEVGSETGYSPTPPTFELQLSAMRDTSVSLPEAHCIDIGGESLLIEVLEGRSFRQAHFWCLEAPLGDEHRRASEAVRLLKRFIDRAGT